MCYAAGFYYSTCIYVPSLHSQIMCLDHGPHAGVIRPERSPLLVALAPLASARVLTIRSTVGHGRAAPKTFWEDRGFIPRWLHPSSPKGMCGHPRLY